jgi:hypothetical protein
MNKCTINILSLLLTAVGANAAESDSLSVLNRTIDAMQQHSQLFNESYDNPAIKQWMMDVSHSTLSVAYEYDKQSDAINPQLGDGFGVGSFNADSYIKNGTSTLWGKAFYRNGKQWNVECNETSDAELIYPYFSTDNVGGDLNMEQYYFAGGFADTRGRWAWGGTLSYLAGLYYRNVDPRPRNVTGKLDVAVGAAYHITKDYYGGLSVNFRKYKQSSDIEFVSEMGSSIIYHATGLGTHYNRFAGTGDASYYNGYRYGATFNLYPSSGNGVIASVGASRFTFDKVLTDLNKLPLCSVWHNELQAQVGYARRTHGQDWAVAVNYDVYRRHGRENIFGDASTSIYPQIGYLEMYADNYYSAEVRGLYEVHSQQRMLSIMPAVGYNHRRQVYIDPRRDMLLNNRYASLQLSGAIIPHQKWLIAVKCGLDYVAPLKSSNLQLTSPVESEAMLLDVLQRHYDYLSNNQMKLNVGVSASRCVNQNYALQLAVDYIRTDYTHSVYDNLITSAIKFIF